MWRAIHPRNPMNPGMNFRSPVLDGADPFGPDLSPTRPGAGDGITGDDLQDVFMLSPDMRAAGHPLVSQRAAENSTDVLSQLARAILDRRDIAVTDPRRYAREHGAGDATAATS